MQDTIQGDKQGIKPQFHYFGNKAGVDGADEIKKKIEKVTQGSSYYQRQKEKAEMYAQKVEFMKEKIEHYKRDKNLVEKSKHFILERENHYKKNIALDRVWVHFDMDMFYVACELLDKPELKDKPCAVGSLSMISTANYVARKFGVRSAMPGFVGKELCPELILLPHNSYKYRNISNIFMRILQDYDPELESMGLDEANLDITPCLLEKNIDLQDEEEVLKFCEGIRLKVNEATQLTASCGIGPNKMIAKLASEQKKPNGSFVIKNDPDVLINFMAKLSVRKVPGIGNVMEQILTGLGINNCQDVRDKADELLQVLTNKTFEFVFGASWGYGRNYHVESEDPQSISCQRTFSAISQPLEMEKKIDELSENVAEDLQKQGFVAKQVAITLKTHKFEIKSKQMNLPEHIKNGEQIALFAKQLLKQMLPVDPLRLIGVRVSSLVNESEIEKGSIKSFFEKRQSKNKCDENQSSNIDIIDEEGNKSISINQSQDFQKSNFVKTETLCPICNKCIETKGNLSLLNRHIDQCLGITSSQGAQNKPPNQNNFFQKKKK